jgi:hypothetical protein
MPDAKDDDFGKYFRWLPIGVGLALIAAFATHPGPKPAPPNSSIFGCYVAPDAPAILLDNRGMHIRQSAFPTIPFHIERLKTGIALTADAPIRADQTNEGYIYAINRRGIGWFMSFYKLQNGQPNGVFDDNALDRFEMLASDGNVLLYEPARLEECT